MGISSCKFRATDPPPSAGGQVPDGQGHRNETNGRTGTFAPTKNHRKLNHHNINLPRKTH
ncbi:MAG: hypothetical protein FWG68_05780 [Defluviitaleaceae bacterium]|nr:hypothetical protein [Defluviitaleaceae bacterium]